jgi:hypothetical protein
MPRAPISQKAARANAKLVAQLQVELKVAIQKREDAELQWKRHHETRERVEKELTSYKEREKEVALMLGGQRVIGDVPGSPAEILASVRACDASGHVVILRATTPYAMPGEAIGPAKLEIVAAPILLPLSRKY